jgi:hypothetical protein
MGAMSRPPLVGTPLPRAPRPRHLFTARLPDSELGFSLPSRQPPHGVPLGRVALEAAAALYQAERWLPALEDWLGCGLLPKLSAVTEPLAESLMFDRHVLVTSLELDAELHLPLSALLGVRTPPPAAFAHWTWHPLACELVLDTLPLGADDLKGLEPGALLVLPSSFATTWQAFLQPANGQGGSFAARVYEARGRLCVAASGEGSAQHPPADQASVRFRQQVAVPPADLLGWSGPKPAALDAPLLLAAHAVMVHGSAAAMASRPLAAGQLIPVGSGFALRLDEVSPQAAAHATA